MQQLHIVVRALARPGMMERVIHLRFCANRFKINMMMRKEFP
jgi:hypothetical protein